MRKVLTIFLALFMVLSFSGAVLADIVEENGNYLVTPEDTEKSVEVTYTAGSTYTVTIPKTITAGNAATISVYGTWADNQVLSVTSDELVTLYLGGSSYPTQVSVDNPNVISKTGDYTKQNIDASGSLTIEKPSSVYSGTWSGKIKFTINLETRDDMVFISNADEFVAFAESVSNQNVEKTAVLTDNIDMDETTWTPITLSGNSGVITIEGKGHNISNLDDPLFGKVNSGEFSIVIKDLTINSSTITSSTSEGTGAFIDAADAFSKVILSNCHLKDSSVSGGRTGGLIGYTAGYANENNGPVNGHFTFTGCTVVNCEITGDGTVGGIVGQAGASEATLTTIENCAVTNCILTSNDDSYRVGAIVGTANIGTVTITNCKSEGNTIKQIYHNWDDDADPKNGKNEEIARADGQSELYGRFVPGTTGKLTIDGVEIQ